MVPDDPILRLRQIYDGAASSESFDPDRAALATADARGRPSVRFVLVREFDATGFRFYTNYESPKARDLDENPWASLAFHWSSVGQQVRVAGPVRRLPDAVSDAYFAARPRGSQIGAWASPQSQPIESKADLEDAVLRVQSRFEGKPVPRPDFWGGYELSPDTIELWRNGRDRLHDRELFVRREGGWRREMLAP